MKNLKKILKKTEDSYSFERYSPAGWKACIKLLSKRGFGKEAIIAFMLSKHMRWAADMKGGEYGTYDHTALIDYFEVYPKYGTEKYALENLI